MLPCIAQSPFKDISLVRIQDECSQTQTPFNCNCPRLAIVLLRRSRLSMYFDAVLPVGNLNGLLPHWLNNKPRELIFLGRQLKEHMHVMHFAPDCRTNNSIWYELTDPMTEPKIDPMTDLLTIPMMFCLFPCNELSFVFMRPFPLVQPSTVM